MESSPPQQSETLPDIGVGTQILLTAGCCGAEACVVFIMIYGILSMQFLGVPVSLLSIDGIVCGFFSMAMIPLLGWISDQGSNPKRRKALTLLCGLIITVGGLFLLIVCCILKMSNGFSGSVNEASDRQMINSSMPLTSENGSTLVQYRGITSFAGSDHLRENLTFDSRDGVNTTTLSTNILVGGEPFSTYLPVTGILSIIGVVCMDIGFDTSMSLTRALIMDNVPTSQRTQILAVATLGAGATGMALSCLGMFDFSSALGPVFGVDGVAAMLVLMATVYGVFIGSSYGAAITTGFRLSKRHLTAYSKVTGHTTVKSNTQTIFKTTDNNRKWEKGGEGNFNRTVSDSGPGKGSYQTMDTGQTKHGGTMKQPLMAENNHHFRGYSSTSITPTLHDFHNDDDKNRNESSLDLERRAIISSNNTSETNTGYYKKHDLAAIFSGRFRKYQGKTSTSGDEDIVRLIEETSFDTDRNKKREDCDKGCENGDLNKCNNAEEHLGSLGEAHNSISLPSVTPQLAAHFGNSLQVSMVDQGDVNGEPIKSGGKLSQRQSHFLANKRLVILAIMSFFSFGTLLIMSVYSSNALTIGIFKGDPTAVPGTPARQKYDTGLRSASLGVFVFYTTYFVFSILNKKAIAIIGPRMLCVLTNCVHAACTALLIATEMMEIYFVLMVINGFQKCMCYTVPFLLAAQYTQDDDKIHKEGAQSTNIGRVMSVIGFLLPAHYMLLSAFMGPLMDAFDSPWVPMYYCAFTSSVGAVSVILLYLIKD